MTGLKQYLTDRLDMEQDFVGDLREIRIRKVYERRPRYVNEVIVTFEDKQIRDSIKAQAYKLASHREEAGMRLHIPDHLQRVFRSLMNVSFDMKKKHPSLKRSVKFDEEEQSLYMDVQLAEGQD